MKRGFLGLTIVGLLLVSTALARQPGPYYRTRQQEISDEFDQPFEFDSVPEQPGLEPEDELEPQAPSSAPRNGAPRSQRDAVSAPTPFQHADSHGAHHHDEPLWPEYYGPPYGPLGYNPCAPIGAGCAPCGGCLPLWGQFDYLLWWGKGGHMPPLVTTSPSGTSAIDAGVLGEPGTSVLFGQQRLDSQARSGGRVNFGMWFDACQQFGIGGSFFAVGRIGTNYTPSSDGSYILARPFYNVETNAQDSELVAYPGFVAGDMVVSTSNSVLGAEAYFREALRSDCDRRLDAIYGYRFMRVDESLHVNDRAISTEFPSIIPLGTTVAGSEYFLTRSAFSGAEFGLWYQSKVGRWGWDLMAKIALGTVRQTAFVNGVTHVTVPGVGTDVQPGSLLALPSNIGKHGRNQFSAIPEVQINVTRCLTDNLKARFGYTFLLMTNVAQVGRQLDLGVNPTQIGGDPLVGAARPSFTFHNTHYWLQGLNFGLEYSY